MKRRVLFSRGIVFVFALAGCGADRDADDGSPPPSISSPPTITSQPQAQSALAGNVVTFAVAASGTAPVAYQWKRNGVDIPGANGASLTLLSVDTADGGVFSVVVSNAGGSVTSHGATLTVTLPPSPLPASPAVTSQPQSQSALAGDVVTFTVEASGTAPLAFQWKRDGVDVPGANEASLTLLSVGPDQAGVYSVAVSNVAGSIVSSEAILTVSELPPPPPSAPLIISQPQSQSALAGDAVTFAVEASGTAPLLFQWRRDGVDIAGAHGTSLTLLSLEPADSGVFSVVVSNDAGSVTSVDATLTVEAGEPPPPPPGSGSGLTAEYYDALFFTGARITRTDAAIDFVWDAGSPDPAIGPDTFSVRWVGQIEPLHSETYTFHTVSDDGVWLSINNQVVIHKWFDQPATEWTGSIDLIAGRKYEIVLDYYENTGAAQIQLYWSSASQAKEIIPATQLYPLAYQASGAILREFWLNIPGKGVADLTGHPDYPDNPSGGERVPIFEGPTDWADNYGTRMQGYVHAPMTGFYIFWLATDDTSELHLSGDENPNNKRLIAHQASFATSREWDKHASQKSQPIFLEAGRRYYIEALQKEGTGGDNIAVGWQLPDGFFERPIPGYRLSPWP